MPAKVASFAGVWRYDEPQAGRYRYFHQWDIEIYGPFSQESDAEVIEFVSSFFSRLGLAVTIEINDRQLIEQYIKTKLGVSDQGLVLELFRAVDKVPKKGSNVVIQEYSGRVDPTKLKMLIDLSNISGSIADVGSRADIVGLESWERLSGLMDSLASRNVRNARVNLGIVRGLDYYSGIVFETFDQFAKDGALVGGGRYDRLTEAFGRKDIGATGAAGGIERIVMALRKHGIAASAHGELVYVAYASDEMRSAALKLVSALRSRGIATEYDLLGKPLRKQLDDASGKKARVAVIVAPSEYSAGNVLIRTLDDGKEAICPLESVNEAVAKILRA